MVPKVFTHSRFSLSRRIKRSAQPLPSGSRMKLGEDLGDFRLEGLEGVQVAGQRLICQGFGLGALLAC